jgi:hypothetical protein
MALFKPMGKMANMTRGPMPAFRQPGDVLNETVVATTEHSTEDRPQINRRQNKSDQRQQETRLTAICRSA